MHAERFLDTLEALPLTTIAAINGGVYGGATDLSLCCDLRLSLLGTRMFMPAARFGLHYYPGGMRRYVTRLGLNGAKKLFLTAMTIDDQEMLRIGFLNEVVERAELGERVEAYLERAGRNRSDGGRADEATSEPDRRRHVQRRRSSPRLRRQPAIARTASAPERPARSVT